MNPVPSRAEPSQAADSRPANSISCPCPRPVGGTQEPSGPPMSSDSHLFKARATTNYIAARSRAASRTGTRSLNETNRRHRQGTGQSGRLSFQSTEEYRHVRSEPTIRDERVCQQQIYKSTRAAATFNPTHVHPVNKKSFPRSNTRVQPR